MLGWLKRKKKKKNVFLIQNVRKGCNRFVVSVSDPMFLFSTFLFICNEFVSICQHLSHAVDEYTAANTKYKGKSGKTHINSLHIQVKRIFFLNKNINKIQPTGQWFILFLFW